MQIFELITGGDYLFDPASGSKYSKDDDHIAQIMELMGDIPKSIAFAGKYSSEFFNRKGELRHISKLRYWPLDAVLHDKYLFPRPEAEALAAFLTPMLQLYPERRAPASELVKHPWLDGIVVQGEVDVLRRLEEMAARAREGRASVERVDAMKPVDDLALADDVPRIAAPVPHTSSGGGKENASGSRGAPKLSSAPHGKPS